MFEDFDLIHSFTRKQAIEDGVLLDVSEIAAEAGFRWPVALTDALWVNYIDISEELKALGQSIEGRLWDVLAVVKNNAIGNSESRFTCQSLFLMAPGKYETVTIKSVAGPGDEGEPVITIMLERED